MAGIFKAYDVRGVVGEALDGSQINARVAWAIGCAVVEMVGKHVVVGMDAREESPGLLAALVAGMQAAGARVQSLEMCGTEEVYFGTAHLGADLGVMVTASHNPRGNNGFKLIRAGGEPFTTQDLGTLEGRVRARLGAGAVVAGQPAGMVEHVQAPVRAAYVQAVAAMAGAVKPLKVVMNCMNGSAGPTLKAVMAAIPQVQVVWMQDTPDGTFPHGLPNPLLPAQRARTAVAVREHKADLGVAFDGDFDRCFVFDATGAFVPPYYMAGMLAEVMLREAPGAGVVHDPRLYWDTQAVIKAHGGVSHMARAGHLFFKQSMRATGAAFGAETSGHFFFKDFYCCDSGVIPFMQVLRLISGGDVSLAEILRRKEAASPCVDETNFRLAGPAVDVLDAVRGAFGEAEIEQVDGLGLTMPRWRANLRASNTEPLLRLNMEARDAATLQEQYAVIVRVIEGTGAVRADH